MELKDRDGRVFKEGTPQISNANFSGMSLRGAVLNGIKFEKVDFRSSDLREADFRESTFEDCLFTDANVRGARFTKGRIVGALKKEHFPAEDSIIE
jgi:uncharacterized protein YjbI with pentapeptide repeats